MNSVKVIFAKKYPNAIIPSKREEDGAFDIYACFDEPYRVIYPGETVMLPTGLISAFSSDYVAILKERGSTGTKGMAQRSGVIDSGYRGEWAVPINNTSNKPIIIYKKDVTNFDELFKFPDSSEDEVCKYIDHPMWSYEPDDCTMYPYEKAIAQCMMVPVPKTEIMEVSVDEVLSVPSERGTGRLGSSGK